MVLAPRKDVEDRRHTPSTFVKGTAVQQNLKTFHLRAPVLTNVQECQIIRGRLLNIFPLRDLTFGIVSGSVHPITTTTPPGFSADDCIAHDYIVKPPTLRIFIACELLIPLQRNDLNDRERLEHPFLTASTIVHELMHAINQTKVHEDLRRTQHVQKPGGPDWREPYFMDEQANE